MLAIPGGLGDFGGDGEGAIVRRLRIAIREIINEFFQSHSIFRWHLIHLNHAAGITIGRAALHRARLARLGGALEGVFVNGAIAFGIADRGVDRAIGRGWIWTSDR